MKVFLAVLLIVIYEQPALKQELTSIKRRAMAADYSANLAELRRLRDELKPLGDDAALGYLAHYWAGFASWRIAINGANSNMSSAELQSNLGEAAAEFDASIKQNEPFADSYAAASSVHGWLGTMLLQSNTDAAREHFKRSRELMARAQELEPDNPRVLWVVGGYFLFTPPSAGGDRVRAIGTYRRAIRVSAPPSSQSPLPDWGKPESLMALAYAYSISDPPDVARARAAADEALKLAPNWSYVRDMLIPQINALAKAPH